ncbi:hypothetical protein [Solibacillus merdavium]|uniref:YesK-like protein n=1 Tax=Solibacillus merdavium TaxID=2762218 RepID=A0ABR8XSI0_9BACL|nr:hypothetical protein [Solibacillus merdavium]MBD8034889.1 hypothetical protein [Solibacillus merdavium]
MVLIIVIALCLTNLIAFKISGKNKKKRIWAGIIVLLLTPLVFFLTGISLSPFDPGGFGTGMMMVLYSFLFAVNGIIIIIIGLFTKKSLNT